MNLNHEEQMQINLAPIAHRVHAYVMCQAFMWFQGWGFHFPFVIITRSKLDNWTLNAVNHAVYRTARVFRGEELP